ncbi:unnamed protein product [Ilex paraguariensis]|uniref:non-specific serine/threonine protein kinase n=1 Tax=Ilex paraguariensis TaxID=185542 RepID=A0ABC8R9D4_9AQUA
MKTLPISLPHFPFICFILVVLVHLSLCLGDKNNLSTACGALFNCGNITGVDYPFRGSDQPKECGHPGLELHCVDNIVKIEIRKVKYRVLAIKQDTWTLTLTRDDFTGDICIQEFVNTTLDYTLFDYASGYENLTLFYGCPPLGIPIPWQFTCPVNGTSYKNGFFELGAQGPGTCQVSVIVPIRTSFFYEIGVSFSPYHVIEEGFEVTWKVDSEACNGCRNSGGRCGYDLNMNKFSCFCPNQFSGNPTCNSSPEHGESSLQASPTVSPVASVNSKC